jgi:PPP family 3-phenylpropionic acid transporter
MANKTFFILSLFYFLFFTLIGDYVIFMPKFFKQIGFSAGEIGVIFAMLPIARFLTPFIFLKKPLTKFDYVLALIVSTCASFLLLTHNFYLILVSFFLIGVSFSIVFPYIEAVAIEKLKEKYGKTRVYGSIGFMLFGILFSYINGNLVWLFIALMLFTNITALYFLRDTKIVKHSASINLLKEWKFWLAVVFLQISFGGFYNFFTIYNLNHGISKEYIGWLWAIGVTAEIFIFLFQHRFISRFKPVFLLKISIFFTAIRWFILYLFPGNLVMVALSQLIHAFSFAIFHTSALLYISKHYTNKTLAQQFYAGIAYGMSAFLGSILSGLLYGDNLFLYESIIAFTGFLIML